MNLPIRCLELLLEGIVVDPSCLCCVVSRSFPRNFLVGIFLWHVAQLVSVTTLASCISVDIGDRTRCILLVLSYGGLESDVAFSCIRLHRLKNVVFHCRF